MWGRDAEFTERSRGGSQRSAANSRRAWWRFAVRSLLHERKRRAAKAQRWVGFGMVEGKSVVYANTGSEPCIYLQPSELRWSSDLTPSIRAARLRFQATRFPCYSHCLLYNRLHTGGDKRWIL